jgi:hypothetical protein
MNMNPESVRALTIDTSGKVIQTLAFEWLMIVPQTGVRGDRPVYVGFAPSVGWMENKIWEGPLPWVAERMARWANMYMPSC